MSRYLSDLLESSGSSSDSASTSSSEASSNSTFSRKARILSSFVFSSLNWACEIPGEAELDLLLFGTKQSLQ